MQMIDVLKRLAELDAGNPNIVKENQLVPGKFYVVDDGNNAVAGPFADDLEAEAEKADYSQGGRHDAAIAQWTGKDWNFNFSEGVSEGLEECGMPGMGGMSQPHTPASINMTAASGEELSAMLKDIMTLAGHAGHDHGDMDMDGDMGMPDMDGPAVAVPSMEPDATSSMRSMIDKLNGMGDDDGDEEPGDDDDETKEWSNTPNDSRKVPDFDSNKFANQDPAGQPGVGDRMDGDRPKAFATTEDRLMWEYKQFIKE